MKAPDGTPLKGARLTRALVALEIVGVAPRRARGRWAMSTELAPRRVGGVRVDVSPRLPRDPSALEAEFAREAARTFAAPLEASAKAYAEHYAATSARDDSSARLDADPVAELERLGSGLTARWSSTAIARVTKGKLKQLTEEIDADLEGQVERVVGVRPDLSGIPGTDEALEAASRETVGLMKDVMPKAHERMSAIVLEGYRAGSAQDVIARRLNEAAGIGMRRAAFVARNEMGNLYAAHTETRHRDLGVTHYVWRTSQDERVRATHAAHEGKRFAWDDAPADTGPPGADFNCRCTAEPDLSGVLEEIGGDEPEPADLPPEARLKGWRKEMGWKQGDLAAKLGRSSSYVSALERGAKELDDADRRALRLALKGSGLDEAELDALLGTLEGVEAPKADPLTEALKAASAKPPPPKYELGATGAPKMSAKEAIERLNNAEPVSVRGAEIQENRQYDFFDDFDQVEALRNARRDHELRRFTKKPKTKAEKTILEELAIEEKKFAEIDAKHKAAASAMERARKSGMDLRSKEYEKISEADQSNFYAKLAAKRTLAMAKRKAAKLNLGVDVDALFKSLADETQDNAPVDYVAGRWRDSKGKLIPEGKTIPQNATWDPDAKKNTIPKGSLKGLDTFAKIFGDSRGKRHAEGWIPKIGIGRADDRAYADSVRNFINTGSSDPTSEATMVHELAHHYEAQNRVLKEAAGRSVLGVAKKKADKVAYTFPGSPRHANERGFGTVSPTSKYVGKLYLKRDAIFRGVADQRGIAKIGKKPDDFDWRDLYATEYTTMSVQEFTNAKDARALLEKDPDRFWFAVAVSRGDFR